MREFTVADLLRPRTLMTVFLSGAIVVASGPGLADTNTPPNAESGIAVPVASAEREEVSRHLAEALAPELRENFELFIYVSKAQQGPWAQRMYVFVKERGDPADAKLIMLESWRVSTGREAMERARNGERMSTETPAGVYQLDPGRFFVQYRSSQWLREMPNAMFFNWVSQGVPTGLAIHGVADPDQISALGRRASAGCVQLPLQASQKTV